jgi:hypothetical protein
MKEGILSDKRLYSYIYTPSGIVPIEIYGASFEARSDLRQHSE